VSPGGSGSSPVSAPFQLTNCATLKFTPKLTALTRANGEFAGHGASLHMVIVIEAVASRTEGRERANFATRGPVKPGIEPAIMPTSESFVPG
jgi:hypothetical protein